MLQRKQIKDVVQDATNHNLLGMQMRKEIEDISFLKYLLDVSGSALTHPKMRGISLDF